METHFKDWAMPGVIPPGAHGAAFGVLTSASLVGMASSPFIAGFVGGASIRIVFFVDLALMAILAWANRQTLFCNRGLVLRNDLTGSVTVIPWRRLSAVELSPPWVFSAGDTLRVVRHDGRETTIPLYGPPPDRLISPSRRVSG